MIKNIVFLKENIKKEERLINEFLLFINLYKAANKQEKSFLDKLSVHVLNQLEIINNTTINLIDELNAKNFLGLSKSTESERKYTRIMTSTGDVFIKKEDKQKYLDELNLKDFKISGEFEESLEKEIRPSKIVLFSARLFKSFTKTFDKKFEFLDKDLKQADMPYILTSYLSFCLFLTFLSIIVVFLTVIALSINNNILIVLRNLSISLIIPALFFVFLIYYPSLQIKTNCKKLENEIPFALAHMSAIASSRIEPSKIFLIMSLSKEYKLFSQQMKKIVAQMNVYGYDLTTALKNVSQLSANKKFSEFLNGFASVVISGGNLVLYIKEKSKDVLLDYKLSRERYSTTIAVYSDIYTALLITAPLILMLILSFMSSLGAGLGNLDVSFLASIGIIAITVLNIIFIIFLNLTQPEI